MKILGISAYYHDSAACIIDHGKIKFAAQEERFTRIKHDASFPTQSIKHCLEYTKTSLDELTCVAFYEKPYLKFERLLESYFSTAPFSLPSFLKKMPIWLSDKLNLRNVLYNRLREIENFEKSELPILFPEHHVSHAASTFFTSPFKEAAILVMDGVGEWMTSTMAIANRNEINIIAESKFPHSIGLLYSAFTYYLGFKINNGEYKVMGLAPYGDKKSRRFQQFMEVIKSQMLDIKEDGSFWLNQFYFDYIGGLKMVEEEKWSSLLDLPKRKMNDQINKDHCNLALAIQSIAEEIILKQAHTLRVKSDQRTLCLAGGVALNSVAIGKLIEAKIFDDLYIMPAAGDAGGSVGAALACYHMYYNLERLNPPNRFSAFLGPSYSREDCEQNLMNFDCRYHYYESPEELINETAQLLKEGNVIGWFQDRMEFGPRALGNRSILAHPGWPGMQEKVNTNIKKREGFRPFAPSIIKADLTSYFKIDRETPYMQVVSHLQNSYRKELPDDYHSLEWHEMINTPRSKFQAVTHVDFSTRIQTVDYFNNPKFYKLLTSFKQKTGISMLLNTSFNLRGEPIVCTPLDALRCFFRTEMDILVLGNFIVKKNS